MSDLANRFLEAFQHDESIDLSNQAITELTEASAQLADTPACAAFFLALLDTGTTSTVLAAINLLTSTNDPGVMAEIVQHLTVPFGLSENVIRSLHKVFLDKSSNKGLHSGTRALALLGSLNLSQEYPSLLRRLQAHLLDIESQDNGDYLRSVAKINGLVLTHIRDQDLNLALHELLLVPEAEDEASFALGLLAIADALDEVERKVALEAFHRAHCFMQRAIVSSEGRQDASLYVACLSILLDFQKGTYDKSLEEKLTVLRQAAFEYSAFLIPSDRQINRDTWLGASSLEGLRWAELGIRLVMLDINLLKRAWLNAAIIIEEELFRIFEASRSILRRNSAGGIEAIVRPQIIGTLQENRVQLTMLDQWLIENKNSLSTPTALIMRKEIDAAIEASLYRNPIDAAVIPASAAAILDKAKLPTILNMSAQKLLTDAVITFELERSDTVTCEILESIHNQLQENPDYQRNAQQFFCLILYYTILFVTSRENMSMGSVSGIKYLFNRDPNNPPLEADLHKDYFNFLQATPLHALAQSESRDVAHGRVDVYFTQNGIKTVAELKKTHHDRTLEKLVDEFGLQATAYQRTNMRFCILMVLDLFDRGGGSDHLRNLINVFQKTPHSGTATYSVVVFRVQGMKKTPTHLK